MRSWQLKHHLELVRNVYGQAHPRFLGSETLGWFPGIGMLTRPAGDFDARSSLKINTLKSEVYKPHPMGQVWPVLYRMAGE